MTSDGGHLVPLPLPDVTHPDYRVLTTLIAPRPIAWASTWNADGTVNLAPFSLFSIASQDPPILSISVGPDARGEGTKDTLRNSLRDRRVTVSEVPPDKVEQMVSSAHEHPPGVSEADAAAIRMIALEQGYPPAVSGARYVLTCDLADTVPVGDSTLLLLAVSRYLVPPQEGERLLRDAREYGRVARLGSGWHVVDGEFVRLRRERMAPADQP